MTNFLFSMIIPDMTRVIQFINWGPRPNPDCKFFSFSFLNISRADFNQTQKPDPGLRILGGQVQLNGAPRDEEEWRSPARFFRPA